MSFTQLVIVACCIGFHASFRLKKAKSDVVVASTRGPLDDLTSYLSSIKGDVGQTCASESRKFFDFFTRYDFAEGVDPEVPDMLTKIRQKARSSSETQQFEAITMMNDLAAEGKRQLEEFDDAPPSHFVGKWLFGKDNSYSYEILNEGGARWFRQGDSRGELRKQNSWYEATLTSTSNSTAKITGYIRLRMDLLGNIHSQFKRESAKWHAGEDETIAIKEFAILDEVQAQGMFSSWHDATVVDVNGDTTTVAWADGSGTKDYESQYVRHVATPKYRQSLWTEKDGMSIAKGVERCEIIVGLARGKTAKELAAEKFVLPHETGEFQREWDAAEREDRATLQQLEEQLLQDFRGKMEISKAVTQGKRASVDGVVIDYAEVSMHYSFCAQAIQADREELRIQASGGAPFPHPWWEKHPACNVASEHAESFRRSSGTYVSRKAQKTQSKPTDQAASFAPGSAVVYYSESRGGWFPAVVQGFTDGQYRLDALVPNYAGSTVRMIPQSSVRPVPQGSAVEYFSQSEKSWFPAVVQGFQQGHYKVDASPNMIPQNRIRPAPGAMLEVDANMTDATSNDAFAMVEIERKISLFNATGDNIFSRIYQEVQRSGALSTTLTVLGELAMMGMNLVARVAKAVGSIIYGTVSIVLGILLAFPRWLLFAKDKHKTFGIGVSDDGLKVWPWCWVVPQRAHSLFNKRMCR